MHACNCCSGSWQCWCRSANSLAPDTDPLLHPLPPQPCLPARVQGFYSVHSVPIIENTARECELTDRLREAVQAYPQANAVLVRRHGVYVWGKNWIEAKTQVRSHKRACRQQHAVQKWVHAAAVPVMGACCCS